MPVASQDVDVAHCFTPQRTPTIEKKNKLFHVTYLVRVLHARHVKPMQLAAWQFETSGNLRAKYVSLAYGCPFKLVTLDRYAG